MDVDDTAGFPFTDLNWRKSSRSGALGNCVEVAPLPPARFAVRDSYQPDGPVMTCPRAGMAAFLSWVRQR